MKGLRHITRSFRSKERNNAADIGRITETRERNLLQHFILDFFRKLVRHICRNKARSNGIDRNIAARKLFG